MRSLSVLALLAGVHVSAQSVSSSSTTILTPVSSASAQPSIYTVQVGNGGNKYTPNSLTAAVGSTIVFQFFSPNHTVGRANYSNPCIPFDTINPGEPSFYSGVFNDINTADPPTWKLTINDTTPTYYYCTAPNSCVENHMIGVINPNSTYTLAAQDAFINANTIMLKPGQPQPGEGQSTATSTPTSTSSSNHSSSSISGGAIAGIVIGALAVFAVIAAIFWFRSRRRKRYQRTQSLAAPSEVSRWSSAPPYESPRFDDSKGMMEMRNLYDVDRHGSPELGGTAIPAFHEVEADGVRATSMYRFSAASELDSGVARDIRNNEQSKTIHELG